MSLDIACQRIAPAWPLDQLIAVNPWWPQIDQPLPEVSARLGALAGAGCLMPLSHYQKDAIAAQALRQAAIEMGMAPLALPTEAPPAPPHWQSLAAMHKAHGHGTWLATIIDQISRFCAVHWQEELPLYASWLRYTREEKGLTLLFDCTALPQLLNRLPETPDAMLTLAMNDFAIKAEEATDLGHGWLLEINGWASAAAYRGWQAGLRGGSDARLQQLLAIRVAWDWITLQLAGSALLKRWQRQSVAALIAQHRAAQRPLWLWHRARELNYQHQLLANLGQAQPTASSTGLELQAVFCIDVRSEPMRRALEAQSEAIETRGFAGFFGLPLGLRSGAYARPQLPGLLPPSLWVRDPSPAPKVPWLNRLLGSPGAFGVVEATGLGFAGKLLAANLRPTKPAHAVDDRLSAGTTPLLIEDEQGPLDAERGAAWVARVLTAMGLRQPAATVLLVGHGATSCNNPHSAGLACGACGGQSGELNVRVLAQLANDPAIREVLAQQYQLALPHSCRFVPALHDTTSDEITVLDPLDARLRHWLSQASVQCRNERAGRLGVADGEQLKQRGWDWSQTRHEWGLADNASFIIAPRQLSKGVNLHGRSFLHDYDWRQDPDFKLLETLLTAPMIVTHWINMQYNASVTAPALYGSGNKVLHNVVANLGVLEGNGGDLRIGLPWQSVHDGEQFQHRPQRLCVLVAAPAEALLGIIAKHAQVRQLIDNEWLFLLQRDDDGLVARIYRGAAQPPAP